MDQLAGALSSAYVKNFVSDKMNQLISYSTKNIRKNLKKYE